MQVAMIGTGYVGLVSGACFAEFGINVICVDKNAEKIDQLKQGGIPIYEPGLDALVQKNAKEGMIEFTTDLADAVRRADAVFIAVGTPPRVEDGHADLSYVYAAVEEIAHNLNGYTVIVDKSTVPVGTGKAVAEIIQRENPQADFDVCSNPEFLREGSAIEDFMHPDRVVIGCNSDRAQKVMEQLYRAISIQGTPIVFTSVETAELTKYAANAFLATKITFINEIANLCEKVGADVTDVARGIGLDKRIGGKFLRPGPGYGGSCFPKDTLALVKTAVEEDTPIRLVETVVDVNKNRKRAMAQRVLTVANGDLQGKKVAVLGVAFKPNTDDMRDSPALDIVPMLQQYGADIHAYDPEAMGEAEKMLSDVTWCVSAEDAFSDADVTVVLTEWNEFKLLEPAYLKEKMKSPCLVDLRNIFNPLEMKKQGFIYNSIGRV